MKKLVIGAIVVCVLLIGIYLGSPYYAVRNFVSVARSGDADQLEDAVDFPRVRESLKAQFNAALIARMQNDPHMKGNPLAGLGLMVAPTIVGQMVDAMITPEGISAMVRYGKARRPSADAAAPANPNVSTSSSYQTLDRFKTTITNKTKPEAPIAMIFERKGLFGWRLIRIELPMPLPQAGDQTEKTIQ